MEVYFRKLFIIFLICTPGIGQSTSPSFCITCSAPSACTGCNINADVITERNTTWVYNSYNPTTVTPYLEANLHFTAYSITTTTSVAGNCITNTGSRVSLLYGYIVPIPQIEIYSLLQTIPGSAVDAQWASSAPAKYSTFLHDAYSSFYTEIGWEVCAATLPPSQIYPTYIGGLAVTLTTTSPEGTPVDSSPTAVLSTNPPETSGSVQRARSTRIIVISVMIPTIALVIILLCFILIRKYRKKRSQVSSMIHPTVISNVQLYVDQKAELEDEERRKHELDTSGITYEMEGEDRIFEMLGDGDTGDRSAQSDRAQELRGAEHSKELEVPSNL